MNDTLLRENKSPLQWFTLTEDVSKDMEKILYRVPLEKFRSFWETAIGRYTEQFNRYETQEKFYIIGIRNLWKRVNYLELNIEVLENQISEDEMISQIRENADNYVINVSALSNNEEFFILKNIIDKVNINFTSDEVSQVFSIDQLSLFDMEKTLSK